MLEYYLHLFAILVGVHNVIMWGKRYLRLVVLWSNMVSVMAAGWCGIKKDVEETGGVW